MTTSRVVSLYLSQSGLNLYRRCLFAMLALLSANEVYASDDRDVALECISCNVIFLNIELLRPEFIGLLGNKTMTPNIDQFFSKSLIFHDVTAPAGETFLSNTAVLTVTPSHQIDIRPIFIDQFKNKKTKNKKKIELQLRALTSVATILKNAGYKTISINQGGRAGKAVFLDRGFDEYSQWSSDLLFEDMVEIIKSSLEKVGDQKFFLLFRPTYLHNHQYRRPIDSKLALPADSVIRNYSYKVGDSKKKEGLFLRKKRNLSEERKRRVEREIYSGQVQYGDFIIKKLFDSLGADLLKRTIIVLYANHGTGLGDNNIFKHGTAYQSSVNVPLLIRMPGMEKAVHVRDPVGLLNLVPTILKMVNIKTDHGIPIETYDLVISGQAEKDRVFYGRNGFDEFIRYNNWKYMVQYGRFGKLFNLESDPGETIDLVEKEPMISRKLAAFLLQYKSGLLKEKLQ
ncbi:sulfatase-like hydrolase/transferase [Desulfosarcina sp.]|nr:sulfatase-like hydrolase/transferase [Desulfosarcina sp.]